jgi:TetR/AcrR family transcriptional repressor of lmrAB and yxaGH operons
MAKFADSKEKTLSAAVKLFSQRGYHGTALQDILEAGGAPRGSLYFHFPKGKEQIAKAAVQLGTDGVRQFITDAAQTSGNVQAFLVKLARGMAANLERSGYREGCPVATMALETAAQSDVLGRAARTAFQTWEQEIKRALISFGMKANQADRTATAVLSQLEGALLLARTYRSLEPMQRAEKALLVLGRGALK